MSIEYFFAIDNERRGPHTLDELRTFGLRPDTLVWHEGLNEWMRADALPELAPVLTAAAPVVNAPVASAPLSSAPPAAKIPERVTAPHPPASPAAVAPLSYQDPLAPTHNNGMAVASLVLGIVSLPMMLCYLFGMIPGILAIIFGIMARKQIQRGEGGGRGMATAGLVCGSISVGLVALLVLIAIIIGIARALH